MAVKAKEYTLTHGADTCAFVQTLTLNIDDSLIDINTLADNEWPKHLSGSKNATVDFDGLVFRGAAGASETGAWEMIDIINTGNADTELIIATATPTTGDRGMTANVKIANVSLSFTNNEVVTVSGQFQIQGAPTFTTAV